MPADLARLGFFPSYIRKRIKPTIGTKNPKIANPKLELSSETFALNLLLNITTQIELQQYIAQKITEKYRFYDTTTKNEMKYTRALLYIMNNAEFNHLSSVQVKDNDYMRSLKYLMNGSGLYPTLYKALEVWGEGADKEVVKYLFDNYEKFYISEAHKKKDLRSWIKKHRADLRQQTLKDYLRGV